MKILVFWDSIARWAFDEEKWWRVERLKAKMFEWGQDTFEHSVYNFSVSSTDTRGVLKGLRPNIEWIKNIAWCEKDNSLIIFAVWTNDARYEWAWWPLWVPEKEFKSNLKKMIEVASEYSNRILFVWALPVDEAYCMPVSRCDEYYENEKLKLYDTFTKNISQVLWKEYLDVWNCIELSDLDDGIHPNTQWHRKVYKKIYEYLQSTNTF